MTAKMMDTSPRIEAGEGKPIRYSKPPALARGQSKIQNPKSKIGMTQTVTLELPDFLAQHIEQTASVTHRPVEELLLEWIGYVVPVESLPDDRILALCDLQMESTQQQHLSDLLDRNREGELNAIDRQHLDILMQIYRQGLLQKAKALKEAVSRGLRSSLEGES